MYQVRREINSQLLTLARQARRMTQSKLAEAVDVVQGTISKIEAGVIGPTDDELQRIADALDYPVAFFEGERLVVGPGVTEIYHNRKRQKVGVGVSNCVYATATIRAMNVESLLRSWHVEFEAFPSYSVDEFGRDPMKVARTVRAFYRAGYAFEKTNDPRRLKELSGEVWSLEEKFLVGPDGTRLARAPGHLSYWFAWDGYLGVRSELYQAGS